MTHAGCGYSYESGLTNVDPVMCQLPGFLNVRSYVT